MIELNFVNVSIVFLATFAGFLLGLIIYSRRALGVYIPSPSLPPPPPEKALYKFPIQVTLFDMNGNSIKCPTVWVEVKDDAGKNGDHVAAIENNAKTRLFSSAKCKIDWSEYRKRYSSI